MTISVGPAVSSVVRQPRFRVLVNGKIMRGCYKADVHSNNAHKASTFKVSLALNADPQCTASWWSNFSDAPDVDVQASFLPVQQTTDEPQWSYYLAQGDAAGGSAAWVSMVQGKVDHLHLDTVHGNVDLDGRDYLAALIDTKTRKAWTNQSASEVVQSIATEHGFTADVTPTKVPVGSYYKLEHDKISLDSTSRTQTEMEVLTQLAKWASYDVWMTGKTIHFHPSATTDTTPSLALTMQDRSVGAYPYPVVPVTDVVYDRDYALKKDLKVTVKTWNSKQKAGHVVTYPPAAKAGAQEYTYVIPGLSPEAALARATSLYTEIVKHSRTVDITMPGELSLTAQKVVKLIGTGTGKDGFEMPMFVDEISRTWGWDSGIEQHVRLKNHSPQTADAADAMSDCS
jgi:phage protein D